MKPESKFFPFEFTARECRELCRALEVASVTGTVIEPRAYRLWLVLDSYGNAERKPPKPRTAKRKVPASVLAAKLCHVCAKPKCDRAVYLAHGNGGAYGIAPAHSKCVDAAGEIVQGWNEKLGWYVRGENPKLEDIE